MRALLNTRLAVILGTVLFPGPCIQAQTFYELLGTPALNEGGGAVITAMDGGFYVGGYRGDSALVMKVDPVGEVQWARTLKTAASYAHVVNQLVLAPDGDLLGCGNGVDGSPAVNRSFFYFKLHPDGTVVWMRASDEQRP